MRGLTDAEGALVLSLVQAGHLGSRVAAACAGVVISELERWPVHASDGPPPRLLRRKNEWDELTPCERLIARAAFKSADEALEEVVEHFIVEALGGASAVLHDAAARILAALVNGAGATNDGNGLKQPKVLALVNRTQGSLQQAAEDDVASFRPALHEITPLRSGRLLYAMPAVTRSGAAVLSAPPDVVRKLRAAYFAVLAADAAAAADDDDDGASRGHEVGVGGLQPDPTCLQRMGGHSPIYDGTAPFASADARPLSEVVEWARVPDALHAEVLEGLRPLAERWCGHKLTPVRFFGVRRYLRGASLTSHIDSDPRVRTIGISITVDVEGLEAPWLLRADGASGEAAGAALPVGTCFVYEATRVRHHRPTPLQARVFANAFCHYTLADWAVKG